MDTQKYATQEGADSTTENLNQQIIEAYKEHVLLHGSKPASIYSFCKAMNITESDFYQHFNDFEQVEDAFWSEVFGVVVTATEQEAEFDAYSVREKFLTFYYNFFTELKNHRSYALLSFNESLFSIKPNNRSLGQLKKAYKSWAKELIYQAVNNNEIASRSKLTDTYDSLFWYQFLFLINFWRKDKSKGFEKTDAAIEKSVNLSFDLIEKNALDSAFDFGKFMFQNR
jgi:AcrR family transcriptional regulator